MTERSPMRITDQDLFDARVEGYLEEQAVISRMAPDIPEQSLLSRIVYSSYFYLGLAGVTGALGGWACCEPFISETGTVEQSQVGLVLLFPVVAAMIGLVIGAAEGIITRNPMRALVSGAVGLGIGFAGSLIMLIPAGMIFNIMATMAVSASPVQPGQVPRGFGLFLFISGRAMAWAVIAIPAGIGQGIALREKKVIWNGVVGAVLGGMLGGLIFDPIDFALSSGRDASLSRAVGVAVVGLMVGVFIGLVEQWTKTAWLLMRAGPLAGKQFIIYRQTTVVGSSPKADIYLFKDDAIEPRHALVHNRGGRFEIEDCGTADGTYINGIPVKRQFLRAGDQIVMGKTVLEFAVKETA
ncbi:MAG: hypothetical protein QOF78_3129 [Phycisphaerales bacterium]|jgi:hypothetical protein|nr:hypothetical protein [Phycisphaerales bacterium]MEA2735038.1 hypothetical protein [Humisphaera sp.]